MDLRRHLRQESLGNAWPGRQGVSVIPPGETKPQASGVVGIASALYRLRWGFKPRQSQRRETPSGPG